MARKPRTPAEDAGVEKVANRNTKLASARTLKEWLAAKDKHREALDDLNTTMAEHTRNAIKKHMNKTAAKMLDQLNRMTPEKLADWEEHFFDGYEKSGLKERAATAPRFEMGEGKPGEEREEEEDGEASGKDGNGGRFPQAAQTH